MAAESRSSRESAKCTMRKGSWSARMADCAWAWASSPASVHGSLRQAESQRAALAANKTPNFGVLSSITQR
ncbi:MAG: hypothetical protein EXR22_00980 [Flavobacteriaceae bacterium]|nr:hypothetical protein [Flavobacteriaceae bacterium]